MEIAAAADMRVAADHAKFGMPETRFGIPSGMEAALLPRLIGWGKAVELVLTGDHIDADEARRIGFLQKKFRMRRSTKQLKVGSRHSCHAVPMRSACRNV